MPGTVSSAATRACVTTAVIDTSAAPDSSSHGYRVAARPYGDKATTDIVAMTLPRPRSTCPYHASPTAVPARDREIRERGER